MTRLELTKPNLIFCGDRRWTNYDAILAVMGQLWIDLGPFVVIEGGARGADQLSRDVALDRFGFEVKRYPADWETHGRAAGPIRNQQMLVHPAHGVVAFHDDLNESGGTANMVAIALKAKLPVYVAASREPLRESALRAFVETLTGRQQLPLIPEGLR